MVMKRSLWTMLALLLLVLAGAIHTTPAGATVPPLDVYLTDCAAGTPMPGAEIVADFYNKFGTRVGGTTQNTNNFAQTTFTWSTAQCCDEIHLTITPAGGGAAYSTCFKYLCGPCVFTAVADWYPTCNSDDTCEPVPVPSSHY